MLGTVSGTDIKSCSVTLSDNLWHVTPKLQYLTCARNRVSRARIMKLVPPAKSVSLSNWKVAAIMKNISCMDTVTMAQIAKWSSSRIWTAITCLSNLKKK